MLNDWVNDGINAAAMPIVVTGMGGALATFVKNAGVAEKIAEVIAQRGKGRLLRIGIQDEFGCSGNADYLAKLYRLTPEAIAETIQKELKV